MTTRLLFDRSSSLVFFLIGVLFIYESSQIGGASYGSAVGPNVFPLILGILLVLSSIGLLIETIYKKATYDEPDASEGDNYKKFIIILTTAVLYAFFLESLGYVISTFLFLLISFQTLQHGKWIASLIISILFSFGVYYIYVILLQGALPGFPTWLM